MWVGLFLKFTTSMKISNLFSSLLLTFSAFIPSTYTLASTKVVLSATNTTDTQRLEVAEFDAKTVWQSLGVESGSNIIVKDLYNQEVAYQITHDGKLLVEMAVRPRGEARMIVEPGIAQPMRSYVDGYFSHWRADDFTWENDRCAYRAYGPALQRSGEKAFGFDVWMKSTDELDVRRRYQLHREACDERDELRRKGRKAEIDATFDRKSFHIDHGRGLDCYNVGPSLGCGVPAIMLGDSIVMPWAFKDYELLDNGPLRMTVELTYPEVKIDGQTITEHRVITLDKGSFFNNMTIWYDGLRDKTNVCSGVVVHTDKADDLTLAKNYVAYCDPTDSPERHNFQIYVATVYPDGTDKTRMINDPWHKKQGIVGNAVGMKRGIKNGERWNYWFGASWCKSGTADKAAWIQQINTFINNQNHPLLTKVVKE